MFDSLDDGERSWQDYGHYEETYVKIDGEWKIRSSKLTRLHHAERAHPKLVR